MDSRGLGEEEDEENCLQVAKCSKGYVPCLNWTLHALRSLTCQGSFVKRRNPSLRGKRILIPAATVIPLLHRSFSRGLLSSGHARVKADHHGRFSHLRADIHAIDRHTDSASRSSPTLTFTHGPSEADSRCDGRVSSPGMDGLSSRTASFSFADSPGVPANGEDDVSSTHVLSPSDGRNEKGCVQFRGPGCINENPTQCFDLLWKESGERKGLDFSETEVMNSAAETEVMKERFAKLLLGEDMSGGAKGVCTARAISNAITNLSASIFGELWRLEPLPTHSKAMWRREMDWLLSVADYIVELVPSLQKFADGSTCEVMITKPRVDVHTNLPALRKLDALLLGFLDSCCDTEFWYMEHGIVVSDDTLDPHLQVSHREEDKQWLPTPKVAASGLSEGGRKRLQHLRECISQILHVATGINNQVLSEMEVPSVFWDALPKSGRVSLGETIYRHITSDDFSAEAVLSSIDLSKEQNAVEIANRLEAAIHIWHSNKRRPSTQKSAKQAEPYYNKHSWGIARDSVSDTERRVFAGRAESLLLRLKQKFPGLRQSLLDMSKIQYNRDVGQAILESYSRVMESLAFNIIARIDDVLFVDNLTKRVVPGPPSVAMKASIQRRGYSLNVSVGMPFGSPLDTPNLSPTATSPDEMQYSSSPWRGTSRVFSDKHGLDVSSWQEMDPGER